MTARGRWTRSGGVLLALAATLLLALPASAPAVAPTTSDRTSFAVAPDDIADDDNVNAVATAGGVTYIGGNFKALGAPVGGGTLLDPATGRAGRPFRPLGGSPDASVLASAPDGAGGYFIGGSFNSVGDVARNNIAHILADGSVDPAFNPNASDPVRALAVSGGVVYAGGDFSNIGGQVRNNIAKLSATSGNAFTTWNPNANAAVTALAVDGSSVYVGGFFNGANSIGGQDRNRIAKLSATSGGAFSAWNPNASGAVFALDVDGGVVYAGGAFSGANSIGGQARNNIAKLSATSGGAFTAWNPNADHPVLSLAVDGGDVYAGGEFDNIGGRARNNLAKLSATSGGAFSAWNPNPDGTDALPGGIVEGLAVSGGVVYAGGAFENIGGQARNNVAKLSATSGDAFSRWNADTDDGVSTLAVSGGTVYAGGDFLNVNVVARNRIAALDAGGTPTAFNPNANGTVDAIAVSGSDVYAGGEFTTIGGQTRNRIAKLSATSGGAFAAFNPNGDGPVRALAISGSRLYAGGDFVNIGGQARNRIAALTTSGQFEGLAVPAFNPNADNTVRALAVSGTDVFAGGDFTNIAGLARNRIAELSSSGAAAPSFDPNADAPVRALEVSGSDVFAGGDFTSIAGLARNRIAKLAVASGNAAPGFDPNADNSVRALALSGDELYAGGSFTTIGGAARNRLAALVAAGDHEGVAFPSFDPDVDDPVNALEVSGSTLHVGGDFSKIGDDFRTGYARFTAP